MNKEVQVINYQIVLSILLIIEIIVFIVLNYNTALDLENKKPIFNKKTTLLISKYRNLTIIVLSILFLYLNYVNKDIAKEKNENLKSYDLQILASYFTVFASFITYYVVINSEKETVSDIENPIN